MACREDDVSDGLSLVTSRAAERSGRLGISRAVSWSISEAGLARLNITGRYHRPPKRFEDDYSSLDKARTFVNVWQRTSSEII